MPSPENPPASAGAASCPKGTDPVFNTITSGDWTRSLASARQQKNAVSEQIQTVISSFLPKTK